MVVFVGLLLASENLFANTFQACVDRRHAEEGPYEPHDYGKSVRVLFGSESICTFRFVDKHQGAFAAIAAFVVAGFTFALWDSTEKLWVQSREAIAETRRGQRAWVTFGGIKPVLNVQDDILYLCVDVVWKNFGNTPATDVKISASREGVIDISNLPSDDVTENEGIIGPGADVTSQTQLIELAEAFATKQKYRIASFMRYRDIMFDNKVRHSHVVVEIEYIGIRDPNSFDRNHPEAARTILSGIRIHSKEQTAD